MRSPPGLVDKRQLLSYTKWHQQKPGDFGTEYRCECSDLIIEMKIHDVKWRTNFRGSWVDLHSLKLTYPLKIGHPKRKLLQVFQPSMFRCHVSLRDGICWKLNHFPCPSYSIPPICSPQSAAAPDAMATAEATPGPRQKRFGHLYFETHVSSQRKVSCLVVEPTHLEKNISQIGSFPQIRVNIRNLWNHHLADLANMVRTLKGVATWKMGEWKDAFKWYLQPFLAWHQAAKRFTSFTNVKHNLLQTYPTPPEKNPEKMHQLCIWKFLVFKCVCVGSIHPPIFQKNTFV